MKIKSVVLAFSLLAFSGMASGLDFGKLLEERINQELNKDKYSFYLYRTFRSDTE